MTFNIGSQDAGQINNVDGDQVIYGGQTATSGSPPEALAALLQIRHEVEAAQLPTATKSAANRHLEAIQRQLRQSEPDKPTIARRLMSLTRILISAGAVVTGATTFTTAITTLSSWLGSVGGEIVKLLHDSTTCDR